MQTFLPYADFKRSAQCLDRQRLGKQRIETFQIIQSLTVEKYGWKNHPAVKMWANHVSVLAHYGIIICEEWKSRGYKDSMLEKIRPFCKTDDLSNLPWWFGDELFHASHRSKLLSKMPQWYGRYGWSEAPNRPYLWPLATPGGFTTS